MKRQLFIILFCLSGGLLFGQFKLGLGIAHDFDDKFSALGGKLHYTVNSDYAGQVGVHYFFPKSGVSAFVIDTDVHFYGIKIGEVGGFHVAPLAGLNIVRFKTSAGSISSSKTNLGINLGFHGNIPITDKLSIYLEPKFVLDGLDNFVLSAGVFF